MKLRAVPRDHSSIGIALNFCKILEIEKEGVKLHENVITFFNTIHFSGYPSFLEQVIDEQSPRFWHQGEKGFFRGPFADDDESGVKVGADEIYLYDFGGGEEPSVLSKVDFYEIAYLYGEEVLNVGKHLNLYAHGKVPENWEAEMRRLLDLAAQLLMKEKQKLASQP